MSNRFIAALLFERAGYVSRNRPDRVAEVDAALAALGYHSAIESATISPQPETATRKKPTRRTKG